MTHADLMGVLALIAVPVSFFNGWVFCLWNERRLDRKFEIEQQLEAIEKHEELHRAFASFND